MNFLTGLLYTSDATDQKCYLKKEILSMLTDIFYQRDNGDRIEIFSRLVQRHPASPRYRRYVLPSTYSGPFG